MKLIIAGTRTIHPSSAFIRSAIIDLYKLDNVEEIVSGGASGVDLAGEEYAWEYNKELTITPAKWDEHGKAAGPIRNAEMAEYADALLLIWDGKSKGSANMKQQMEKRLKPVYEIIVKTG